ncbi:type II toxin-antitoxin system RelE/ParE family toxin [Lentibacillus sp. CBA3610]|uniref:type II toxin-antitoxin system RelE/ParE family toxin n=1 Tax=Lentibacillus sp. CBA3610 TaxID=2518176 RepID=UPI001595BB09|nr:type II toxin-antitoxin system RelE/ParE family toxin [Lentibacillus sp. CBA3610]
MVHLIGKPHVDYLEDDIYELRTKFSTNIFRTLFFHYRDGKLILLHGFTKKQQKTPRKEIIRAKKYRDDFLRQKKGGMK